MQRKVGKHITWAEQEINIIKQSYRTLGVVGTQKRLAKKKFHRTRNAVYSQARSLGLECEPEGKNKFVFLCDAEPDIRKGREGSASQHIIKAAKKDDIAEKAAVYPHKWMAPIWWVDEYMGKREEERQIEAEAKRRWFTAKQTAPLFGLTLGSFQQMTYPKRQKDYSISEYIARIPSVMISNRWYFKPEESIREGEKYQARQHLRSIRIKERRLKSRPRKRKLNEAA